METDKIYNVDCLEFMKTMPDKCCDVFTDPPYNVKKDYGIYKDNLSAQEYTIFVTNVINEIKRIGKNIIIYIPKKWNLLYWNLLGAEFVEIILSFTPHGAIRNGFSNQFNKLLTNTRPPGKPVLNVWPNMQQTGLGFFFKENTYGNPGYTSEAITKKAINELTTHDCIFDPFMGVGTTAVCCKQLNKQYVGCELNLEYIKIAEQRLAQAELFNQEQS